MQKKITLYSIFSRDRKQWKEYITELYEEANREMSIMTEKCEESPTRRNRKGIKNSSRNTAAGPDMIQILEDEGIYGQILLMKPEIFLQN